MYKRFKMATKNLKTPPGLWKPASSMLDSNLRGTIHPTAEQPVRAKYSRSKMGPYKIERGLDD